MSIDGLKELDAFFFSHAHVFIEVLCTVGCLAPSVKLHLNTAQFGCHSFQSRVFRNLPVTFSACKKTRVVLFNSLQIMMCPLSANLVLFFLPYREDNEVHQVSAFAWIAKHLSAQPVVPGVCHKNRHQPNTGKKAHHFAPTLKIQVDVFSQIVIFRKACPV